MFRIITLVALMATAIVWATEVAESKECMTLREAMREGYPKYRRIGYKKCWYAIRRGKANKLVVANVAPFEENVVVPPEIKIVPVIVLSHGLSPNQYVANYFEYFGWRAIPKPTR